MEHYGIKKQTTEREKMFNSSYICHKGIISRIYKELNKSKHQKAKQLSQTTGYVTEQRNPQE